MQHHLIKITLSAVLGLGTLSLSFPAQARLVYNGAMLQGANLNGYISNGTSFQGTSLNGYLSNGIGLQGTQLKSGLFNGKDLNSYLTNSLLSHALYRNASDKHFLAAPSSSIDPSNFSPHLTFVSGAIPAQSVRLEGGQLVVDIQ